VILLRDIMKVWDCFGAIYQMPGKNPGRQLTTMSAAYAAETMPHTQMPAQTFQQVPVQMGEHARYHAVACSPEACARRHLMRHE